MATAKEQVLQFVQELPEGLSLEDLENRLLEEVQYWRCVRKMIEQSREEKRAGRMISHEEMGQRLGIK